MLSYDNKVSKAKLERRGSFSQEEGMLMDLRVKVRVVRAKRVTRLGLTQTVVRSGDVKYKAS